QYALLERAWGDEAPGEGGEKKVSDAREAARSRARDYRWYLLGEGKVAGGDLTRIEELRCRVRYFTEGVVIGSQAYVDRWFAENRGWFGRRKTGAQAMGEGDSGRLFVLSKRGG
ncbi:MAG: hypothetical protein JJT96_07485, partial [Opitutales bacterium]|nr:hypothetical protein [Opitutales bacterium]